MPKYLDLSFFRRGELVRKRRRIEVRAPREIYARGEKMRAPWWHDAIGAGGLILFALAMWWLTELLR